MKNRTKWISTVLSAMLLVSGCSTSSDSASSSKDGTYTATSKGFGGDVTVTVKVEGGKITEATAEGKDETESIGSKAIEQFNDGSLGELTGKSADEELTIDSYTGATMTSTALKNDLKDIMTQLGSSASSEEKKSMKAGVYTETVYGNNYSVPFTVTVTLTEDSIENIEVTDIGGETADIIQTAFLTFRLAGIAHRTAMHHKAVAKVAAFLRRNDLP